MKSCHAVHQVRLCFCFSLKGGHCDQLHPELWAPARGGRRVGWKWGAERKPWGGGDAPALPRPPAGPLSRGLRGLAHPSAPPLRPTTSTQGKALVFKEALQYRLYFSYGLRVLKSVRVCRCMSGLCMSFCVVLYMCTCRHTCICVCVCARVRACVCVCMFVIICIICVFIRLSNII